jgi:hypothetical protein
MSSSLSRYPSDQFRFLRAASYANIKGSVGLILAKASTMRISIPVDLSSRSFYTITVFHSFETSSSTFSSFPRFYSSAFCLSVRVDHTDFFQVTIKTHSCIYICIYIYMYIYIYVYIYVLFFMNQESES